VDVNFNFLAYDRIKPPEYRSTWL